MKNAFKPLSCLPAWLPPFALPLLALPLPEIQAGTVLQDDIVVHYSRMASDQLTLDIRPIEAASVGRVSAQLGGTELHVTHTADYPAEQQFTMILFLVDTSDPSRQQAMGSIIRHIDQLLELQLSQRHFRYGLARFDTDLHFMVQPGADADTVRRQIKNLEAKGETTELYRNTLAAIKQLSRFPADRRVLFLLSDGRAEDHAYFHRDVVQAAIKNNISLFTVGYAESVGLTIALQTLRRLSEDTGGLYLSAQPGTYQLDNDRLRRMLDSINRGARFDVDLSPVLRSGMGGPQKIFLSISSDTSHTLVVLPIQLPASGAIIPSAPVVADTPKVVIKQEAGPPTTDIADHWYWLLISAGVLLGVIGIYLTMRPRRRNHDAKRPDAAIPEMVEPASDDVYAWLEMADDPSPEPQRFPIRSATIKIGRYRGNDISLPDDSAISRYHAEVRLTDEGRFVIADMGSTNGLLVNGEETLGQQLEGNDIIEIGDVRLRLIIPEKLADDLQDTKMFKTQVPDH